MGRNKLFAHIKYLVYLYIVMDELIELGEYRSTKKIILVGDKDEAFLLNLMLKPKKKVLKYIREADFLIYLDNMKIRKETHNRKIKYILTADCRRAIKMIKMSNVPIGNYIISPISRENSRCDY